MVDALIIATPADDVENVVGTTNQGLYKNVSALIVEHPLTLVAIKREREDGVASGTI